jgi:S-adenosylmethionine:tRNA ribosyltransferase-isomerase
LSSLGLDLPQRSAIVINMPTPLADFDYRLPPERIAQTSLEPRESAKLLVLDRSTGITSDRHVGDLPTLINKGDLLIFNDSKVFKARLEGALEDGSAAECFLLHPLEDGYWEALIHPGKKLQPDTRILFAEGASCVLKEKTEQGTAIVDFAMTTDQVFDLTDRIGSVPVPPYVEKNERNQAEYQTIYAKERGSVAAPTAGFHFTPALLKQLKEKGVQQAFVTLHVGLGTFRPIKTTSLEAHQMHSEWGRVTEETARLIHETKKRRGRVIAVGTTATRALESWAGQGSSWSDYTDLFITPGYNFRVIDGLMTNFHLPKSTLIVLVSAFAGRENVLAAYKHAIEHDYRFYSFGDAMLIHSS